MRLDGTKFEMLDWIYDFGIGRIIEMNSVNTCQGTS